MGKLAVFLVLLGSSCTRSNPEACCVTDQQCAALGVTAHLPCAAGQACSPATATCVASECETSAECGSADAPVCVNHLCTGACQIDDDCLGIPDKPLCQASTGQCIGCLDATTCPTDKAFCDTDNHACRGCVADSECASGVCVEADGTCATSDQLLFVSSVGADAGDCVAAPCASLGYALQKVTELRRIVRVTGGQLADTSTVQLTRPVTIDGDGTTSFSAFSGGPGFTAATTAGVITLEGVVLRSGGNSNAAVTVAAGSSLRLYDSTMNMAGMQVNGALDARRLRGQGSGFVCTTGTLTVRDSTFDNTSVTSTTCQLSIERNRFDPASDGAIFIRGGFLAIENNVFVVASEYADLISTAGNAPGSTIAFNTIVNTATVLESPVAIACDVADKVTSNIIAYHSTNPIGGDGCVAHASLFDLPGAVDASDGTAGDPTTFFQNLAGGDYHLGPGSPALGLGVPGIVIVDLEGNPRPVPAGSAPDAGAYEAR